MIIFLSCVKSKKNKKCKAEDMYTSELFKKSLAFAKQQNPKKIYILSAKYGLLELFDEIEPYEMTLNNMNEKQKKIWAYYVCKKYEEKGGNYNELAIFLCGVNYRKYLIKKFKNYEIPCEHLAIGKQLKFYKESCMQKSTIKN